MLEKKNKNFKKLFKSGIYNTSQEHDSCGVGLVASINGQHNRDVVEAGIKALKDNPHGYSNARGILELREAIASENYNLFKKNINPEHILVSPGGKPIIFIAISMLAGIGSEIILPNPSFPIYKSIINYCGSKPIFFPLKEEKLFGF